VNDVSSLVNVTHVGLIECPKITNISMLKGVKRLTIGNLPSLTTYQGLGNHYKCDYEERKKSF